MNNTGTVRTEKPEKIRNKSRTKLEPEKNRNKTEKQEQIRNKSGTKLEQNGNKTGTNQEQTTEQIRNKSVKQNQIRAYVFAHSGLTLF